MMKCLSLALALFLSVIFIPVASALAAEPEGFPDLETLQNGPIAQVQVPTLPKDATSCFEYYSFGSVSADVGSSLSKVVSGTPMAFKTTMINTNPYPIVDASLYVKIFRKLDISGGKLINGHDVVDQFVVKDGLTLGAGEKKTIDFTWQVPAYAATGDYYIATFVQSGKAFNLLGLTFTDDVVGNIFNFRVSGEVDGGLTFDKQSVTVNDRPFYFAAFPPRISKATNEVRVSANLLNTTDKAERASVSWKVYSWDALQDENLIDASTDTVLVPANGSMPLSYVVKDTSHPVYYVLGEVRYRDTHSYIGVRFVRDGVDQVRINFPAVTSYPITSGNSAVVFSCLHSMGTADKVDGTKLTLTIRDAFGLPRFIKSWSGYTTGEMMAYKGNFAPWFGSLSTFTLEANLYQNGVLVDSATQHYDCQALDPASCGFMDMLDPIIAVVILVFIFAGIAVFTLRRKKKSSPPQSPAGGLPLTPSI